jgi:hypothetical protein
MPISRDLYFGISPKIKGADELENMIHDQAVKTLGLSADLVTAGSQWSAAETFYRYYGPLRTKN